MRDCRANPYGELDLRVTRVATRFVEASKQDRRLKKIMQVSFPNFISEAYDVTQLWGFRRETNKGGRGGEEDTQSRRKVGKL